VQRVDVAIGEERRPHESVEMPLGRRQRVGGGGEGVRDSGEMLANDVVEQRALARIVVIERVERRAFAAISAVDVRSKPCDANSRAATASSA